MFTSDTELVLVKSLPTFTEMSGRATLSMDIMWPLWKTVSILGWGKRLGHAAKCFMYMRLVIVVYVPEEVLSSYLLCTTGDTRVSSDNTRELLPPHPPPICVGNACF